MEGEDRNLNTAKLVERYEAVLNNISPGSAPYVSHHGNIAASAGGYPMSEAQGKRAVELGLEKIDKAKSVAEACGNCLEWATSLRAFLEPLLASNPQTALPWTIVSVSLEILAHPAKMTSVLYTGVERVVQIMVWYSGLAETLLSNDTLPTTSRSLMKDRFVDLYKTLLHYQMKSVCAFYRHQIVILLRLLVFADDWSGEMQAVLDAEASLAKDVDQYTNNKMAALTSKFGLSQEAARQYEDQLREAEEARKCLSDLGSIDPRRAMVDLQRNKKDPLVAASFEWILGNDKYAHFAKWQDPQSPKRLWINGQPGKGKTMLMIGIIDTLLRTQLLDSNTPGVVYFFCQGDTTEMNNVTAVLKGLIWLLVQQQPTLIRHLLSEYKRAAGKLFSDSLCGTALFEILAKMLKDAALQPVVFVIDGLDECNETSRSQLIDAIIDCSDLASNVKWIVSSRRLDEIEIKLRSLQPKVDLELDKLDLREPVRAYINYQLDCLSVRDEHEEKCRLKVKAALHDRAGNTFLWVWLICKELKKRFAYLWMELLDEMPDKLEKLFEHLLGGVHALPMESTRLECKSVLSIAALAFRPLTELELRYMADLRPETPLDQVVIQRGSFLSQPDGHVHLIHKSAQDYLLENFAKLGNEGTVAMHNKITARYIARLKSSSLEKNICQVASYGTLRSEADCSLSSSLDAVRYACQFWVSHLEQTSCAIDDDSKVYDLLEKKFLPWIENLSWIEGMSRSINLLSALQSLIADDNSTKLSAFLKDARCFLLHNGRLLDLAPRQVYAGALIFAPHDSVIRNKFREHIPRWLDRLPAMMPEWGPRVLRLTGDLCSVTSIAIPANSDQLASGSREGVIRLWELATEKQRTWKARDQVEIMQVALSFDNSLLASSHAQRASHWLPERDYRIDIWNAASGDLLRTLEGHSGKVTAIAFSKDNKVLVSASDDKTTRPWNVMSGQLIQQLEAHDCPTVAISLSPDDTKVASASSNHTVKIWSMKTWDRIQEIRCVDAAPLLNITFLPDSVILATVTNQCDLRYWHTGSQDLIKKVNINSQMDDSSPVAISPDAKLIASHQSRDIRLFHAGTGERLQALGHGGWRSKVLQFSPDCRLLADATYPNIRLWSLDHVQDASCSTQAKPDFNTQSSHKSSLKHASNNAIWAIAISLNCELLASSTGEELLLWKLQSKNRPRSLRGLGEYFIDALAFSSDSKFLVSSSRFERRSTDVNHFGTWWDRPATTKEYSDRYIKAYNLSTWETQYLTCSGRGVVEALRFSKDGLLFASLLSNGEIEVFKAGTGECYRGYVRLYSRPVYGFPSAMNDGSLLISPSKVDDEAAFSAFSVTADGMPLSGSGSLTRSGDWIVRGSEKLCWLPFEYRAIPCAFGRDRVVFGLELGVVEMIQFRF